MGSNPFLAAIMAVAILNGIFSPFFVVTSQVMLTAILPPLASGRPFVRRVLRLAGCGHGHDHAGRDSGGLFERVTGRQATDAAAYSVWLVTAIVISFPALLRAAVARALEDLPTFLSQRT